MKNISRPALGYILKGYPRISETFISNEILQLEQLGFRIVIFPMRQPRESFSHESVKRIKASVHYLPTYLLRDLHRLLPPNILLALFSPRRYGRAVALALKRFARTGKPATFKHLFQAGYMVFNYLMKSDKVDHLHGHFAHSPTSVTMFASLLSGIPYSFTAHAKDIYTSKKEQLREKINRAEFVATCTKYNATYLREVAGSSTTPVHCIYHGIDTSLFHAKGARVNCTPPYALLTVARLTEKKGLPSIYRALAEIKKRDIKFTHTLIGDGDDRMKITRLIEELDLKENCRWLGTQTHEQVLEYFRSSDLFLLGCRIAANGDRDGIPNVLVESLAMGVPAISTDVSAIPELVINQQTGLVVPPDDWQNMAEAILLLLSDQELRQKIIIQGQRMVRENFDNTVLSRQLADLFITHHSSRLKEEK